MLVDEQDTAAITRLREKVTGIALMPPNQLQAAFNQILNDTDARIRDLAETALDRILNHWLANVGDQNLSVHEDLSRILTWGQRHKYLLNRRMSENPTLWELQGIHKLTDKLVVTN